MDGGLPGVGEDGHGEGSGGRGKTPGTVIEGSQEIDPTSTEWTDEKHSMYLNSIEASFIDQLYSSECLSKNMLRWISRTQKHPSSSGSNANGPLYAQFKVQRRGSWENLNFKKIKSPINTKNESRFLSANQWIKHYRSPSFGKEEYTNGLASQKHVRDPAVRRQPPASCSQIYHQDSVGSNTEVSDQNFVEKEFEEEEKLNNMCRTKRARASVTAAQFIDQVVPSGIPFRAPNSDENYACLKAKDAELGPDPPLLI